MSTSATLDDDESEPADDGMLGRWASVTLPKRVANCARDNTGAVRAVQGASFVPLSISPTEKVPFLLMGKQTFNWQTPLRGNRWSLLGGCTSRGENPWDTAAREFHEETCGVVAWKTGQTVPVTDWRSLAEELRANKTVFHITLEYMHRGKPMAYHVYVKLVPWDPSVTRRFKQLHNAVLRRKKFTAGHPALRSDGSLRHECREMSELNWWSVHKLHKAVYNRGGIITNNKGQLMSIRASVVPVLAVVLRHIMGQQMQK